MPTALWVEFHQSYETGKRYESMSYAEILVQIKMLRLQ